MSDFIGEIIKFLFRFIFSIIFFFTGELVLYIITLGKRKPRWDFYANESSARFVIFSEISIWIGMAFWIGIIAILYNLFLKK